ncbi:MAG: DNA translocase FtsK 4TM domain-containing protein [Phycisphaerales bacterium]|nr:DNA translocase FtsK 4TM domain-containing protein [Phycisphaerales bacterium]
MAREGRKAEQPGSMIWLRAGWVAGLVVWLFISLSLVGFDAGDPPAVGTFPPNNPVVNWCGKAGSVVSFHAYQVFGFGAWVLVILGGLLLGVTATGRRVPHIWVRVLGALALAGSVAGFQAIALPSSGPVPLLPGGLIGTVGAHRLGLSFGPLGSALVLLLMFCIGAVVALDVWALIVAAWTGRTLAAAGMTGGRWAVAAARAAHHRRQKSRLAAARDVVREHDLEDAPPGDQTPVATASKRRKPVRVEIDPDAGGLGGVDSFDPNATGLAPGAAIGADAEEDDDEAEDSAAGTDDESETTDAQDDADGDESGPTVFDPAVLRAKMARLPVRFANQERRSATDADLRDLQGVVDIEGYRFPGLDQLEEPEGNYTATMEAYVREQAENLERALKEYKIDGEVVGVESGPVITMYELKLAAGTKVAALTALSSDLARSLKSVNIRIVPNMAGRDTVGVEVPNLHKEKVRLKELMSKSEASAGMRLPMFLGKDASGEPLIADLAAMPHILIAGTTGSGKSVCMNSILMSFLYTKKPNELKLVLVDPKMVELSQFKDIPHLMCPVVTEMNKAAAILEWAVTKMDERYELLAEAGCRDLAGYNELPWEELKERMGATTPEDEAKIPRKLPFMVFVIDELADLMMTNKEVEGSIVRIAQKARAVGIHLILATQRPQANVVTGLIKSNMPARICFKVASGMDSRIVLDQKGGELLLGQGDMLYLSPRSSKLTRAQGTLVDDKEIRRVTRFMRDVAEPTFERSLMQIRTGAENGVGAESLEAGEDGERNGWNDAQQDPLFDQAVEVVLETKRGSVSMLQRRLAIGYTRAARLIELMGQCGILGSYKGTVAREVAMTTEEWQAMKAQAAADAAASAKDEGLSGGPGGELNSHPSTGESLEAVQARLNGRGGDGGLTPGAASPAKATDEPQDDAEYEEEGSIDDDSDSDGEDTDPPLEIKTRGGDRTGQVSGR